MPIYEYLCRECQHQFELFVQGSRIPECPSCRSAKLEQQLSVFAVGGKARSSEPSASAPCGTCGDPRGPGSCSLD